MSMFKNLRSKLVSKDPIMIQNYIGYASPTSIHIKGRIIENEGIIGDHGKRTIKTLLNNFKRFESDELAGAAVTIRLGDHKWELKTDREGYFTLDQAWSLDHKVKGNWLLASVEMEGIKAEADVFLASSEAKYGVITDIDDTILESNVNSLFKLKMLYATFFQAAHQRRPMEGMVELFRKFSEGSNPVFYISHSPWNIYDLLLEFMEIQKLPKGPILLRDYGLKPVGNFKDHKLESIRRILRNHPNLPFVMLGDTAGADADFYIELAHEFPQQIRAIYIRQTKDDKNARRIKKLIESHSAHATDVILTTSSVAMLEHAKSNGYVE